VLDEPTAGVDIELRKMLWENVRRLNRDRGTTIILTTHYLEEAEEMCDEIAIINQGQKIAQDTTGNLLGQLDQKSLIIQPMETDWTAPNIPRAQTATQNDGCLKITYSANESTVDDILRHVSDAGMRIKDIRTDQADLEDVFLELTRDATRNAP
jgi:ABC-2 type transport system ATP-binding protein